MPPETENKTSSNPGITTVPILCEGLSPEESARLAELEPIIEHGFETFKEVGQALLEISDRRLYRQTHSTFKEYVKKKWNISVSRAYQLCEHAKVLKSLPHNVQHAGELNPRQTAELAKVPVEERAEVIQEAAATGRVTAKALKAVAQKRKKGKSRQSSSKMELGAVAQSDTKPASPPVPAASRAEEIKAAIADIENTIAGLQKQKSELERELAALTPEPEPAFVCESCGEKFEDDSEAEPLYECNACCARFTRYTSADGEGHRCPNCNKFGSKVSDLGCPSCGEDELIKRAEEE